MRKDYRNYGSDKKHNLKQGKSSLRLTMLQRILIVLIILLAIATCLVFLYKSIFVKPELPSNTDKTNRENSTSQEIDWGNGIRPKVDGVRKSKEFYTVLILGRDTGGGGNTDTMLLASYDVSNQKATVMSIPRDTMVNVSWDVKKINSVYNSYGGGENGIKGLYKEISQLIGFEPDYQVILEWEAVGKIVDAIGGVYFDVPYDMDYHDPVQDLVIEQGKGYRLLDGEDAMQVIRWRKNDKTSPYGFHNGIGDSGRMEVQQSFLKAVIKQVLKPENMLKIGEIINVFEESVETDLTFRNMLWFAEQAYSGGLNTNNITFLTMPWEGVYAWSYYYNTYLDYVVPIPDELLEIVNTKLSPFVAEFALSDLDIMSVNSDGSLRSTTGHLEDSRASMPIFKSPQIQNDDSENEESQDSELAPLESDSSSGISDTLPSLSSNSSTNDDTHDSVFPDSNTNDMEQNTDESAESFYPANETGSVSPSIEDVFSIIPPEPAS